MSEYLSKIVYLTEAQYNTVVGGTAVNGHSYDPSAIYITDIGTLKMTLNHSTSNANYRVLMTPSSGTGTGNPGVTTGIVTSKLYANPSTGRMHANGGFASATVGISGVTDNNNEGGEIQLIKAPNGSVKGVIDVVYDTWDTGPYQNHNVLRMFGLNSSEQLPSGSNGPIRVDLDTGILYGAGWNDYAEYRLSHELEPGRVVQENDSGWLTRTTERLIPGAAIISDTYGFAQGATNEAKVPIAVAGRVLAYTTLPRENYHAGMAVCSGPNGTIDIMTREEIKEYPDCIIGYVSEVPQYKEWSLTKVNVDGRIWVRVR